MRHHERWVLANELQQWRAMQIDRCCSRQGLPWCKLLADSSIGRQLDEQGRQACGRWEVGGQAWEVEVKSWV